MVLSCAHSPFPCLFSSPLYLVASADSVASAVPLRFPRPPLAFPHPRPPFCPPCCTFCLVGSGVRCCHDALDIGMTRRHDQPCGTHIARSCTSTWACIRSRRWWQDKPNVLVPGCEPPAPSPSSYLRFPLWCWSNGMPGLLCHLRLWLPLLLEELSMTSRLFSDVYLDVCTNYQRTVFMRNFR